MESMKFGAILAERLKSLPKTMQVAEQIFNYVNGGYEACDNASLNNEEIEQIIGIIKLYVPDENTAGTLNAKKYQEAAKKIEEIIDAKFE